VTSYVIRGGAEGKARLAVLSAALEPSTSRLLAAVGLGAGMRCLDLGCGGGDVTLAMAHVVGPEGAVVGIDMDDVQIDLARRDAAAAGVAHVEFRAGDATTLDASTEYDLVYARLLLTHLPDPHAGLQRMVDAVKPGGTVVVEDLDHSAVFSYPPCTALDQWVALYNEVARRRGGDPEIGPKLPGMFRRAGLDDLRVEVAQPVFTAGPGKQMHRITLDNVRDALLQEGVATREDLDSIAADLDAFAADPDTLTALPRIFQVVGRRPE
jgi:SAM-dependent methyltransferase